MSNITDALPISKKDLMSIIGFPDYSRGTSQGAVTSYTATSKGWVYVYYETPAKDSSQQFVRFYINGNPVHTFGTAHANVHGTLLPINSGDVVTGKTLDDVEITFTEIIFYPMK